MSGNAAFLKRKQLSSPTGFKILPYLPNEKGCEIFLVVMMVFFVWQIRPMRLCIKYSVRFLASRCKIVTRFVGFAWCHPLPCPVQPPVLGPTPGEEGDQELAYNPPSPTRPHQFQPFIRPIPPRGVMCTPQVSNHCVATATFANLTLQRGKT